MELKVVALIGMLVLVGVGIAWQLSVTSPFPAIVRNNNNSLGDRERLFLTDANFTFATPSANGTATSAPRQGVSVVADAPSAAVLSYPAIEDDFMAPNIGNSDKMMWNGYPAASQLTNICIAGAGEVISFGHRFPSVELHETRGASSLISSWANFKSSGEFFAKLREEGGIYHGYELETTVLLRSPHHGNIAHGFHDSLWAGLVVLRGMAHQRGPFKVAHEESWLGDHDLNVQNTSHHVRWADGVLAAAMDNLGIPRSSLMRLPSSVPAKQRVNRNLKGIHVTCFRHAVYIGSSRDGCVPQDHACKKGHPARAEFLDWVGSLKWVVLGDEARKASQARALGMGKVPSGARLHGTNVDLLVVKKTSRLIRVGFYTREDVKSRHVSSSSNVTECIPLFNTTRSNYTNRNRKAGADSTMKPWAAPDAVLEFTHVKRMPRKFSDQVRLWAGFDIMIAAAGAATTNALWMDKNSAVIALTQCSKAYLSWVSKITREPQIAVHVRMCAKHKVRKEGSGYVISCNATLKTLIATHLRLSLAELVHWSALRIVGHRYRTIHRIKKD